MEELVGAARGLVVPALILALASGASAADAPKVGEGAHRLVARALKVAQRDWHEDACVAALEERLESTCSSEFGKTPGHYNGFEFYFFSAEHPLDTYKVEVNDSLGEANCEYSKLDQFTGGGIGGELYDQSCIREMTLDSGDALAKAQKYGLVQGEGIHNQLIELRMAANSDSHFWRFPVLRRRTFWIVGDTYVDHPRHNRYIDAKNGKLLLKDSWWQDTQHKME